MVKAMMGTKTDMTVDREIQRRLSRNGHDRQNRIFALKLDNPFCPITVL